MRKGRKGGKWEGKEIIKTKGKGRNGKWMDGQNKEWGRIGTEKKDKEGGRKGNDIDGKNGDKGNGMNGSENNEMRKGREQARITIERTDQMKKREYEG